MSSANVYRVTIISLFIIVASCSINITANTNDNRIPSNRIVFWGHSAGVIIEPFIKKYLEESLDVDISFEGCSVNGESILQVAARQGSMPSYFIESSCIEVDNGYRIADKKSPLLSTYDNSEVLFNMAHGFNPCTINNIEGWIYRTDSTFVFRPERGQKLILKHDNEIKSYASSEYKNALITIFWCDQKIDNTTPSELVKKYEIMTHYVGNDNYFIMGAIVGTDASRSTFESALAEKFGEHFFNGRDFLLKKAKEIQDEETTEDDMLKIQQGQLPSFFMKDALHLNEKAANIISQEMVMYILDKPYVQSSIVQIRNGVK